MPSATLGRHAELRLPSRVTRSRPTCRTRRASHLVGWAETPWSIFGEQNRVCLVSCQRAATTLPAIPGGSQKWGPTH
jgi:hypothetical protein